MFATCLLYLPNSVLADLTCYADALSEYVCCSLPESYFPRRAVTSAMGCGVRFAASVTITFVCK